MRPAREELLFAAAPVPPPGEQLLPTHIARWVLALCELRHSSAYVLKTFSQILWVRMIVSMGLCPDGLILRLAILRLLCN